ncbi:hypothetical protein L484_020920 [Morus notabilis]|uniref:SWIM-type domain-containing protein n=1 Tax=Morus notabilis TaxID=981085 RepID=W9QZQ8_9ROSA|nr:hypothetical protein L484_020920 [Morus notabilis]
MSTFVVKFAVNLDARSCSCRKWDLSGIPCAHVIVCIWNRHEDPEQYVDPCYKKEAYMKIYCNQIYPITNQEDWPHSGNIPMTKPIYKKQAGRPPRLRRLEHDELIHHRGMKMRRHYVKVKCGKCGCKKNARRTIPPSNANVDPTNVPPPKANVDPTTISNHSSQSSRSSPQSPLAFFEFLHPSHQLSLLSFQLHPSNHETSSSVRLNFFSNLGRISFILGSIHLTNPQPLLHSSW